MATKKTGSSAKKAGTRSTGDKRISKSAAERALALHVLAKSGLPRGEVVKLLERNKVDPKTIEKVVAALVPYGHT